MKKRLIVALALLIGLAFSARMAFAGAQDFVLHNDTGVEIHELYVSPADTDNWEENLIEGQTIPGDGSCTVSFDPSHEAQMWDIMVKDSEGNGLYWRDVDLIQATEITLHPNGVAEIK